MKTIKTFKLRNLSLALLAAFALAFYWSEAKVLAHGGEDHGEAKPKTETTDKGTVSHTTRVGDLEVMLKHERLIPDAANAARLFVTKFETNEAYADVAPAIEIEATSGAVTQATVEKTETAAGSFTVKIPALPEGTYLIRAKITHGGETDTATFSGAEVNFAPPLSADGDGGMSWARTALITFIFLIILALFGGLIYFVLRFGAGEPIAEKTVSA
jgi:hypothetical protein